MRKYFRMNRLCALLLSLLLLLPLLPGRGAASGLRAGQTYNYGKPYYIMVNRQENTVTVYGLDERGYYTQPVRAMICTTGREEHRTPLGTYTTGRKSLWNLMFGGTYAQYTTVITGDVLFHSVCYRQPDPTTLICRYYNDLGSPGSLGCVRLQTVDAKWIYDNCPSGTRVTIYDSPDPGPLGRGERLTGPITPEQDNGWDPTDPREENPWHRILAKELPFTDVAPEDWYYEAVRFCWEKSWVTGIEENVFAPQRPVDWATALSLLHRLAGSPGEAVEGNWYDSAVLWAREQGLLEETELFAPDLHLSRGELMLLLYRYEQRVRGLEPKDYDSLAAYEDVQELSDQVSAAVSWAVGNGIMTGTSPTTLVPGGEVPRAQAAALLYRYALHMSKEP